MTKVTKISRRLFQTYLTSLVIFLGSLHTAHATECGDECFRTHSVKLLYNSNIETITANVRVAGSLEGMLGALVSGRWIMPNGNTVKGVGKVNRQGRAEVIRPVDGQYGEFIFEVLNISKDGFTYDAKGSGYSKAMLDIGDSTNQRPFATISADVASGWDRKWTPLTVKFDASSSLDYDGYVVSYEWSFGDGTTSSDIAPAHTFVDVGYYLVSLVVTDNQGAFQSSTVVYNLTEKPSGCVVYCSRISEVTMTYVPSLQNIKSRAVVVSESGDVRGYAKVSGVWTLPDGTTKERTSYTDYNGEAIFNLIRSMPGIYTFKVVHVEKGVTTFDVENSNMIKGMLEVVE